MDEEHLDSDTNLLAAGTGPDKAAPPGKAHPHTARTFAFCGAPTSLAEIWRSYCLFTNYKAFEEIRLPRHSQTLSDPVLTPESQSNEQVKQRWLVRLLFICRGVQWVEEGEGCGSVEAVWMDMCPWCVRMDTGFNCEGRQWSRDMPAAVGAEDTVYCDTITIHTTTLHSSTPSPPAMKNIH